MNLEQLPVGQLACIASVDAEDPVMLRLMEMGLVPGTPIAVRKRAPFGGPLELRVRDYLLSLRRTEARRVFVDRG